MSIQPVDHSQSTQAAGLRHLLSPAERAALNAIRVRTKALDTMKPLQPQRLPDEPGSIVDVKV